MHSATTRVKPSETNTYLIAELTMLMWSHGNRAPLARLKLLYKETPTQDFEKPFGKKGAESFGKIKSFIWAFTLLRPCLTRYWSDSLAMFPDQFLHQLLWVLKFPRSFFWLWSKCGLPRWSRRSYLPPNSRSTLLDALILAWGNFKSCEQVTPKKRPDKFPKSDVVETSSKFRNTRS